MKDNKDKVVNDLLKRISNLEFEVEDKEKENERLNNKNEELLTLYTTEREVKDYYKNIINELDNWLEENRYHIEEYDGVLTYLRKLKGDDKE